MSKLQTRNAFSNTSLQDTDLFWIEVDLGDGTFESQKITGLQLKTILSQDPLVNDVVYIDQNTPTTGGVVFSPNTPLTQDVLYVSTSNGSTWIYDGSAYVTYTLPTTATTPFYLSGTTIDAGGNKTTSIKRTGDIVVGTDTLNSIVSSSTGLAHTSNGFSQVYSTTYSNSEYPIIRQTRRRGTQASSTPAQNGDILGTHSFNSNGDSASISVKATETHGLTTRGSEIILSNCANGTASQVENLKIQQDGKVKISNAYTLPSTAPTSGQVLGYSSAGVSDWIIPSTGGVWGISNSSGIYTYYTTLTLAMASAVSGNTIELFTDVVESTSTQVTLKNGVDINFNGHSYTLASSGTASCFYVNYAGRNRFYNGKIIRSGGTASNSNSVCILVDAVASSYGYLDFFGVEVYSSFGVGISGVNNTIPYINGATIRTFSHGAYYNTGVVADKCTISTFGGGHGIYISRISNSYVETSAGGHGIVFPYSGRASNCYSYVYGSGSGYAIWCQSGAIVTNCTAISTRNAAIYNFAAESYNCYAYSTAGAGFECGSNAGGNVYNSTSISTAGSSIQYAGIISGCYVTSTAGRAVEGINGGVTSNVYNSTCITSSAGTCYHVNDFINNSVKCNWNNSGGYGVLCLANNTITNNTIIVTNASANALYQASAITLKYANNCFKGSTTPVNANITQGVSNTQDSQGNILL